MKIIFIGLLTMNWISLHWKVNKKRNIKARCKLSFCGKHISIGNNQHMVYVMNSIYSNLWNEREYLFFNFHYCFVIFCSCWVLGWNWIEQFIGGRLWNSFTHISIKNNYFLLLPQNTTQISFYYKSSGFLLLFSGEFSTFYFRIGSCTVAKKFWKFNLRKQY